MLLIGSAGGLLSSHLSPVLQGLEAYTSTLSSRSRVVQDDWVEV